MNMKKNVFLMLCAAALLSVACRSDEEPNGRWTAEKANVWYAEQGWKSGCDYIPANAINQIEMWSSATFDPETIDKELGWAQELGFKTMRVFLSSVVWQNEPEAFKKHIDAFLTISDAHGIKPMFVFFDDCWDGESAYGVQREPKPGVHNSGWVRDPSVAVRADSVAMYAALEPYVKDILKTFKDDQRIFVWDLYNEPGNSSHGVSSLPLLKKVFQWAREVHPSQPLTAGLWRFRDDFQPLNDFQTAHSDVISYHCYSDPEKHLALIQELKAYGRPLICTEYMARTQNSTFQNTLPMLKEQDVCAYNWGFVSGKTNTIFAWSTPLPDVVEPELWFHDILRQDKTPFDPEEIAVIKQVNGITR